jgi:hypothetical protein
MHKNTALICIITATLSVHLLELKGSRLLSSVQKFLFDLSNVVTGKP